MSPVKRIPVTEPVRNNFADMYPAGQPTSERLTEMNEDQKKHRLEEEARKWHGRKKAGYVSLSEIKD